MGPEKLERNLSRTLIDMKIQTDLEPGGPTGLCHPVVMGALTGEPIRFIRLGSSYEQKNLERSLGLKRYPVFSTRQHSRSEIIPRILEQDEVSVDAIIITGTVRRKYVDHVIAVVPENGTPPYHVIDSLLPDATCIFETPEEVVSFIDERFEPGKIKLFVIPDEQEKEKRSGTISGVDAVRITDDIFIEAPHHVPESLEKINSEG